MIRSSWQLVIGMTALTVVGALIWADRNMVTTTQPIEPAAMSVDVSDPAPLLTIPEPQADCIVSAPAPMPSTASMALPPMPESPAHPLIDPELPSQSQPILIAPPQPEAPAHAVNPLIGLMALTPPNAPPARDCEDVPVVPPPATCEPPIVTPVVSVSAPAAPVVDAPVPPGGFAFPWRFSMETSGGRTQFELRRGEDSLLRVQCNALDFSSPGGGLVARGEVIVTGPCHEARCERLTLAWQSGEVALDGGVQLSIRHEGMVPMMRAEALTFRLGGPHQPVEFSSHDVQIPVQPKP